MLKDIKSFKSIDIDLLYLVSSFFVYLFIILLLALLYWYFFYFKNTKKYKKIQKIQKAKHYLKNMNLKQDARIIAYTFSLKARKCLSNNALKNEYNALVLRLKNYKYKKNISNIDNNLLKDIKSYINKL